MDQRRGVARQRLPRSAPLRKASGHAADYLQRGATRPARRRCSARDRRGNRQVSGWRQAGAQAGLVEHCNSRPARTITQGGQSRR
jgi:hypothetical protein